MARIFKKYWWVFNDILVILAIIYSSYVRDTGTNYPHMMHTLFAIGFIWGVLSLLGTIMVVIYNFTDGEW